jgi:hypothetical protein
MTIQDEGDDDLLDEGDVEIEDEAATVMLATLGGACGGSGGMIA